MAIAQSVPSTGQITWTRDLARDLFPGTTTPFAWTTLRAPVTAALRRALIELGASVPARTEFWRLDAAGRVDVNAAALAQASRTLYGVAWLGTVAGEPPAGLWARLRAGNTIQQAHARIAAAQGEAQRGSAALAQWLAGVRGLRWSQADLLQVMEELEPRAQGALQTYFILRAGLSAAGARVAQHLAERLPDCPADVAGGLFTGLSGLPTVEAAVALAAAARDMTTSEAALARYGHRGPGEMRPDARRWGEHPSLLAGLAASPPLRSPESARVQRETAEAWAFGRLTRGQAAQFEPVLRAAQALCRAVDGAWDALIMVMAATQHWAQAIAAEALAAGLIAQPTDVMYLELEELKQIATGERHLGHREAVQEAVAQRRALAAANAPPRADAYSQSASPGPAHNLAGRALPAAAQLPANVIWLGETADPGCAPFWLSAGAVPVAGDDPWAPGLIAARAMGLPAVMGAVATVAQAMPGQSMTVDGDAGLVSPGQLKSGAVSPPALEA